MNTSSIFIDALVKKKEYKEAFRLLKKYEAASCRLVYNYLQGDEEQIYELDSMIRDNIVSVVGEEAK